MRPIVFMGHTLQVIRGIPDQIKVEAGYELDKVQRGEQPRHWKPLSNLGTGIREIRIQRGGAWRIVYVVHRESVVYVLHAFQKKSQKLPKEDSETILRAFRELI